MSGMTTTDYDHGYSDTEVRMAVTMFNRYGINILEK